MHDEDNWWQYALCKSMNDLRPNEVPHEHTDYFFEGYEDSEAMAKVMDEICLSCPVRKECLQDAIDNNATGLWGAIYFTNGRVDKQRNAHKTEDIWAQVKDLG